MKRRDVKVAKMVANMKAKGIEQALKDAAKQPEKEVVKTPTQYDFKNFDSKSFAAWAKSSSENADGRLRTF
jgi:IS30 family transposase